MHINTASSLQHIGRWFYHGRGYSSWYIKPLDVVIVCQSDYGTTRRYQVVHFIYMTEPRPAIAPTSLKERLHFGLQPRLTPTLTWACIYPIYLLVLLLITGRLRLRGQRS